MEVLAILLSLCLLMVFAYRGFSVILFAPVFALLAAVLSGLPILPTYTELYMVKTVGFVKNFFPLFILGAVLGKVMEDSGSARKIALIIIKFLGKERAIMAIITSGIVLCYGGISTHVISFALYPEFFGEMVDQNLIQLRAPQLVIVRRGQDAVHAAARGDDSDIRPGAAKVGHHDVPVRNALSGRPRIVRQQGRDRFRDELQDF